MSTSAYHSASPSSALLPQPDTALREFAPPTGADAMGLAGTSAAVERLRLQVRRIGPHFRIALVSGEAGAGKEHVARALHSRSQGANPGTDRPFVACHAAALKGSDPFATLMKTPGRGTLFLDDIGEMLPETQAHLLRLLRQREWSQNGPPGEKKMSVRLIASSTQDLRGLVSAGRFRQELYRRIATLEIAVPPLRERTEDIPELANNFLRRSAAIYGKRVERIAEAAIERLTEYRWPGNVRELERVIEHAVRIGEGTELRAHDLPELAVPEMGTLSAGEGGMSPLQDVVERHVLHVLKSCAGNKLRAAEVLGISRSTLYRMLESCSPSAR